MDGAEPGEVGPADRLGRRAPVHRGHPGEGGPAALRAGPGLAVHLVPGAEARLPDELRPDVDVPPLGEIAGRPAAEEAAVPAGEVEDAEAHDGQSGDGVGMQQDSTGGKHRRKPPPRPRRRERDLATTPRRITLLPPGAGRPGVGPRSTPWS